MPENAFVKGAFPHQEITYTGVEKKHSVHICSQDYGYIRGCGVLRMRELIRFHKQIFFSVRGGKTYGII